MFKVLISPDSFKESLDGMEVSMAIREGLERAIDGVESICLPVADGGDGTIEALVKASNGSFMTTRVLGPLGVPIDAIWGVMGDGVTAVIEMARASGLALLTDEQRDPRYTTTFGTGQLIYEAIQKGYKKLIIGIGGSATNDGGVGMAQALGVKFLDQQGKELPFGGAPLINLKEIDTSNISSEISELSVLVASDVSNPLCGKTGASAIYGPQKGANPTMVLELDSALKNYADVISSTLGKNVELSPGAGAAGGLGAGLMAFMDAELRPGIDLVTEALDFDKYLQDCDLVITGEGAIDGSTIFNKAPVGVAKRAKKYNIPVIAFAGTLGDGYQKVYEHGIDAVFNVQNKPMSLQDSMKDTKELLIDSVNRVMRVSTLF